MTSWICENLERERVYALDTLIDGVFTDVSV